MGFQSNAMVLGRSSGANARLSDTGATYGCSVQGGIVPGTLGPRDQTPVIFGDRRQVPAIRIRLVVGDTRSTLPDQVVAVNYGWRWLEYPYPEHGWGAWST